MPLAVVNGDLSLGHCWPPATAISTMQSTVKINNISVIVGGDSYTTHPGPCGTTSPHPVRTVTGVGSPTVFISGYRPYREGDLLNCGDVAKVQNQESVFFDGLGAAP